VIHRPKKVFQVGVYDPLAPALYLLPHLAQGVLRRSPSPISEVRFVEYRFEDRFQPVEQRLLADPVINRGNAKRAILSRLTRLRDLHLPHRLRLIAVPLQFALQSIQLLIESLCESAKGLSVYTSTTPVGMYTLPGHLQVLPLVHLVDQ